MGMTGLVYAVIVIAWAFYLVPKALKRHDQATRTRSIERFSSAMRVLSHRPAVPPTGVQSTGSVEAQVSAVDPLPRPSLRKRPRTVAARPTTPPPASSRAAARAAAARRRRVFLALISVALVVGTMAGFGIAPWWAAVPPAALSLVFLAACRRRVLRESDAYWSGIGGRAGSVPARRAARISATYGSAIDDEPVDRPDLDARAAVVVRSRVPDQDTHQPRVEAVPVETSTGEPLWDPVPVTLPTYVSKPQAPRTIRTIDLSEPGTYSSGRLDETEAAALAEHQAAVEAAVDEQDRAVGS